MNRYVFMYLGAIVLANLTTSILGPGMSIVNAFLFIGLDLTSRDKLHEAWHGNGLIWKMALLIGSGSLISWALNHNAAMIALASFVSFAVAAVIDTIAYQLLIKKPYAIKVNGSNVFSALSDSLLFPTIAFGGFMPWITLGQFIAKVGGGFVWSIILRRRNDTTR
jgi:queuosine precursor transporter